MKTYLFKYHITTLIEGTFISKVEPPKNAIISANCIDNAIKKLSDSIDENDLLTIDFVYSE